MRLLLAAGIILAGMFMVTVFGNVPLNNALARVDTRVDKSVDTSVDMYRGGATAEDPVSAPPAVDVWENYRVVWRRWNTVRAFACLVASVVLLA